MGLANVNTSEWPVPPIYICNATQHDVIDAQDCIASTTQPVPFQPFEMSSFWWGSRIVGYWKMPSTLHMASAMEMSGAATSGTTGADGTLGGPNSWVADLAQKVLVAVGGETGRFQQLRPHGYLGKCLPSWQHRWVRVPSAMFTFLLCFLFLWQLGGLLGDMVINPFIDIPKQGLIYMPVVDNCYPNVTVDGKSILALSDKRFLGAIKDGSCVIRQPIHQDLSNMAAPIFKLLPPDYFSNRSTGQSFVDAVSNIPLAVQNISSDVKTLMDTLIHTCVNPAHAYTVAIERGRFVIKTQGLVCKYQWHQYIAIRGSSSASPVCHDEACNEVSRMDISNASWWRVTKRKMLWPPRPTEEAYSIKNPPQCVEKSYADAYSEILEMALCPQPQEHEVGDVIVSPVNHGCLQAKLLEVVVNARFSCFSSVLASSYAVGLISLTLLMLVFAAVAFPWSPFLHWVQYSQLPLLFLRSQRRPLMMQNVDKVGVPSVFLADGGHSDNSAVFPLLRRRCKHILAVDASAGHDMASVNMVMDLARKELSIEWRPPEESKEPCIAEHIKWFEKPRARYIGSGVEAASDESALHENFVKCQSHLHQPEAEDPVILSESESQDPLILPLSIRQLVCGVKEFHDGHVYVYFHSEAAVCNFFETYPAAAMQLKMCHALVSGDLGASMFLPVVDQQLLLRNVLHVEAVYADGNKGQVYFLRGEIDSDRLAEVRKNLAPDERKCSNGQPPMGVVPDGQFPSHSTGSGEGYGWAHINAYAAYAKASAAQAWYGPTGLARRLGVSSESSNSNSMVLHI